jgi:hypothetical protein
MLFANAPARPTHTRYEAPDPVPVLKLAMQDRAAVVRLEAEATQLRTDVKEYESEFASLKNQDITIRELEEQIQHYQANVDTIAQSAVASREAGLLATTKAQHDSLAEREQMISQNLVSGKSIHQQSSRGVPSLALCTVCLYTVGLYTVYVCTLCVSIHGVNIWCVNWDHTRLSTCKRALSARPLITSYNDGYSPRIALRQISTPFWLEHTPLLPSPHPHQHEAQRPRRGSGPRMRRPNSLRCVRHWRTSRRRGRLKRTSLLKIRID